MILLIHITLALASVAHSTLLLVAPSRNKLRASYGLTALTLASGTYLVASTHARILQACMSGLLYVGFVAIAVATAHAKLAKTAPKSD